MTEIEPLRSIHTPSTSIPCVIALLALLQAGSPFGNDKNPVPAATERGVEISYNESESTGNSLAAISDHAISDEFLLVQMEGLFHRVIESQSAVEAEFHLALTENRSEMYTIL